MPPHSLASATARLALALVGDAARVGERLAEAGREDGGWPRFWSYWFSAGVPVARSH